MSSNSIEERVAHPIRYPLQRCPACGSQHLDPVVEESVQAVHFLCHDCDRCWNVQLGFVQRVAPMTCAGCPERARCERVYDMDQAT